MNLQSLGTKHGTDKAKHGYLPIYQRHLEGRGVGKILEIGVKRGASLRMWAEAYPLTLIYGVDIDPQCKKHEDVGIEIFIGSQEDPAFLAQLPRNVDLIVDDGSHVNEWTVRTFRQLWSHLAPGGLYVIEDLGCSYQDIWAKGAAKWPGMRYNDEQPPQHRETIDDEFTQCIHAVDNGQIEAAHFYHHLAMFDKPA